VSVDQKEAAMPNPQTLVGKYIDFGLDMGLVRGGGQARVLDGPVLPSAGHAVFLGHPSGVAGEIAVAPAPGAAPWMFAFLRYVAGAVTTCTLAGPVMTGPMSGCYLCRYTQNGQQRLAHIGTAHSETSEDTVAVKAAWVALVATPGVGSVWGGSPSDYFSVGERVAAGFQGRPAEVVGCFEGGSAWAVLVAPIAPQSNALHRPLVRVALAKPMTLQPWSSLAAMRRFRV
jgi:hypothetical protein